MRHEGKPSQDIDSERRLHAICETPSGQTDRLKSEPKHRILQHLLVATDMSCDHRQSEAGIAATQSLRSGYEHCLSKVKVGREKTLYCRIRSVNTIQGLIFRKCRGGEADQSVYMYTQLFNLTRAPESLALSSNLHSHEVLQPPSLSRKPPS